MTAKRYRKLGYALMSKIMVGSKDAGKVLKAMRKAKPNNGLTYAQAWEYLKPIREQYGM